MGCFWFGSRAMNSPLADLVFGVNGFIPDVLTIPFLDAGDAAFCAVRGKLKTCARQKFCGAPCNERHAATGKGRGRRHGHARRAVQRLAAIRAIRNAKGIARATVGTDSLKTGHILSKRCYQLIVFCMGTNPKPHDFVAILCADGTIIDSDPDRVNWFCSMNLLKL